MPIRPVRTEADYDAALARIDSLWGAESGTPDGDELDILLTLVESYERDNHPVPPADPVEAIKFVMEQKDLSQVDLIPYIGSKARVSEILGRKRPLTLAMIRALNKGLGISMEILAQDCGANLSASDNIDWSRYPVKEIVKFGFVRGYDPISHAEEIMLKLQHDANEDTCWGLAGNFRQGMRRSGKDDPYAIQAWLLCAKARALKTKVDAKYQSIDMDFLRQIAKLSVLPNGPLVARDLLLAKGIVMCIVPHFKRTYLDGAAFLIHQNTPVVALTLRYDRVDNFWFTLLHELAHIMLGHISAKNMHIVDNLDVGSEESTEIEADSVASEASIPESEWEAHPLKKRLSIKNVRDLAWKVGIHSAIVAGRVRRERKDYRILSREVGHGEVRRLFPEVEAA